MTRLYGSYQNRMQENKQFCDEITIGTGMTEYLYTDRNAYEVVAVKDQKHVSVRRYDVEHIGEDMANNWKLISNAENPVYDMTKRGQYWYWTVTITADILDEIEACEDTNRKFELTLFLCHNGVDQEVLRQKGEVTKYHRANVSFGTANYYYDYEF